MIFYTATKEAATTTHKNTVEEQYRHAPLNGLIIGAIVGAVWALVVLGYLISLLLTEQDTELCPPELVAVDGGSLPQSGKPPSHRKNRRHDEFRWTELSILFCEE